MLREICVEVWHFVRFRKPGLGVRWRFRANQLLVLRDTQAMTKTVSRDTRLNNGSTKIQEDAAGGQLAASNGVYYSPYVIDQHEKLNIEATRRLPALP